VADTDLVYATLEALKASMKITDTDRDDMLATNLSSASRYIERCTGRRFWLDPDPVSRTLNPRRRLVPDVEGTRLLVDDIGSLDGLVVESGRAPSWSVITGQMEGEPSDAAEKGEPFTSLLYVGGAYPVGLGLRIRVTARWGYPAIPAEIEQATLIQASRLFKRKDSPEGVAGSAEWGVMRLSRTDPDVYALIEHHILPGFA
jgi:hypothetical protein